MANEGSSESVVEHSMFDTDVTPFAAPNGATFDKPTSRAEAAKADAPTDSKRLSPSSTGKAVFGGALWRRLRSSVSARQIGRAAVQAASADIERGIAFVLAPVLLAAGAVAYYSLRSEPALASIASAATALALCCYASRRMATVHTALVALLVVVTGALFAKVETLRAGTRMLGSEVTTQLTGRVAEVERMANGRVRLTVDVTGTQRPTLRYAPDRVRVSARRVSPDVTPGSLVTGLVRLMSPSGPVRPGGYDFSFESYFDGIGASGFFLRGPEHVAENGVIRPLARFRAEVEGARHAIAERISGHIGGPEGEIAAALVVGVRAGIPEDVNDVLRRSGIYHVISISGLHMALVAGTIMGLLRLAFALFPDFSSRHPVKKYAAGLALAGLSGYLFMSGAEVAAQRSFIMLAVMLVAVLFDRAALTLRNLAVSAIIVVAISPHEVVGPSFQMSFAATAALVGAYAAWSDWRRTRPRQAEKSGLVRKGARYVLVAMAGLAATSLIAGGATSVYAAWHFQQMPSLGLFTNLVAMPVVSTVVMPFAVLGSLAMPFGLDEPFFRVMGAGLSVTIGIARWFAERSPIDMVGPISAASVALLTIALIVATLTSTWLRVASVPFALVGLLFLLERPTPGLLLSEDARLVGLDAGEGRIAVNRARPNSFTIDNWRRIMLANEVITPAGGRSVGQAGTSTFTCADDLCLATVASGMVVAHVPDAGRASDLCSRARIIVIEDPSAKNVCQQNEVLVVTGRDLALGGSATITFGKGGEPEIRYAVDRPYRPWHEHRRFSRAARGLPPYRNRKNPASDNRQNHADAEIAADMQRRDRIVDTLNSGE